MPLGYVIEDFDVVKITINVIFSCNDHKAFKQKVFPIKALEFGSVFEHSICKELFKYFLIV